jgi:D-sedoheptulose 7-phosphate isomerase
MSSYAAQHLKETAEIASKIDPAKLEKMVDLLVDLRERGGRLFILGVGGSAGNASHAVCDFRRTAAIDCAAPTDNPSELTAHVNDESWESLFVAWLKVSRLERRDALLVFSVGGGNKEKNISTNLVNAVDYAREKGATILGIVGRDGGHTAKVADVTVIVPTVNPESITPHTEAYQSVLWHLLVTHPKLKARPNKWESTK